MRTSSIKAFFALLGFSALTSLAITANAAPTGTTMNNVKVLDITVDGTNFVRVSASGPVNGTRPTCHSTNPGWSLHYGFDASTAKGKALLTTLTSAMLSGKSVSITGAGNGATGCTVVNPQGVSLETLDVLTIFS